MRLKGLVFDFDGTLAELNLDFDSINAGVRQLAMDMGLSRPWPTGYVLEVIEQLTPELGQEFAAKANAFIESREVEAAGRGGLFPFTESLLAGAREMGLGVAIVTRNCGPAVRTIFPDIDEACHSFLPREAVANPKPHPIHVLTALKALGLGKGDAAMVGDHPMDVLTAKNSGCFAVGVASGRMGTEVLSEAGADMVLPDASGLLAALDGRLHPRG